MKSVNTTVFAGAVIVALLVGGAGGYFFRNYQMSKARGNFAAGGANGAQRFVAGGARGTGATNGAMRGGAVTGSILSMDDKSVTVKMQDGSTKIVLFSGSTTYSNTVSATKTDLKVGGEVAVFGATNSDGSVTATNVQINPQFGRMMPSPTPSSK